MSRSKAERVIFDIIVSFFESRPGKSQITKIGLVTLLPALYAISIYRQDTIGTLASIAFVVLLVFILLLYHITMKGILHEREESLSKMIMDDGKAKANGAQNDFGAILDNDSVEDVFVPSHNFNFTFHSRPSTDADSWDYLVSIEYDYKGMFTANRMIAENMDGDIICFDINDGNVEYVGINGDDLKSYSDEILNLAFHGCRDMIYEKHGQNEDQDGR